MWMYAGNRDGVPRRVERNLEMYAQRRQADTEMRRDLGPGEVVSQVVAQRPMAAVWGDAKKSTRLGRGQITEVLAARR